MNNDYKHFLVRFAVRYPGGEENVTAADIERWVADMLNINDNGIITGLRVIGPVEPAKKDKE